MEFVFLRHVILKMLLLAKMLPQNKFASQNNVCFRNQVLLPKNVFAPQEEIVALRKIVLQSITILVLFKERNQIYFWKVIVKRFQTADVNTVS